MFARTSGKSTVRSGHVLELLLVQEILRERRRSVGVHPAHARTHTHAIRQFGRKQVGIDGGRIPYRVGCVVREKITDFDS